MADVERGMADQDLSRVAVQSTDSEGERFTTFAFWRTPLPQIDSLPDNEESERFTSLAYWREPMPQVDGLYDEETGNPNKVETTIADMGESQNAGGGDWYEWIMEAEEEKI